MKPHIKKGDGYRSGFWIADGLTFKGIGSTPARAYQAWLRIASPFLNLAIVP